MNQQPENQPQTPQQPQVQPAPYVPTGVQPQTYQPQPAPAPAEEPQIDLVFEEDLVVSIKAAQVDDMRFIELYGQVQADNSLIGQLFRQLLGSTQMDAIYSYYESRKKAFTLTKLISVFEKFEEDLAKRPDFLK